MSEQNPQAQGVASADQIFQVALEMEEVSALFYEGLADNVSDPDMAAFCRELTRQETLHFNRFAQLRAQYAQHEQPLADEERHLVQELIADRILPSMDQARHFVMEGSLDAAFELAVRAELNAVALYEQLRRFVKPEDAAAIELVIEEERSHIRDLLARRQPQA